MHCFPFFGNFYMHCSLPAWCGSLLLVWFCQVPAILEMLKRGKLEPMTQVRRNQRIYLGSSVCVDPHNLVRHVGPGRQRCVEAMSSSRSRPLLSTAPLINNQLGSLEQNKCFAADVSGMIPQTGATFDLSYCNTYNVHELNTHIYIYPPACCGRRVRRVWRSLPPVLRIWHA